MSCEAMDSRILSKSSTTSMPTMTMAEKAANTKKQAMRLAEFYAGKNILLTGATGFIGKVCLVKLVSSLSDCGRIFILLRSKKGMTSQQRFNLLLNEEPFKSMKTHGDGRPINWSKVAAIDGDMSAVDLGLSDEDKKTICETVNIVINLAASVQFDAPIKQNLRDNYLGASNILRLSCKLEKLISFVHVSTFYSNSHISHIEEKVIPMDRNCEKMSELINWMPESICKSIEPQILENRPNTYVFTKAMAENHVQSYQGRFPISIVRPSIVLPSVKDPEPGWVDNVNGPMGLGVLASLGILRTIDWNYYGVADMIPVDTVANSILCVAERAPRLHPKEVRVYNCSSSSLNPVTWGEMFEKLREESIKAPPYKMLRTPIQVPRHRRANKLSFALTKISELLFAYFIDFILTLCGQKRLLVKLTSKLHHGYEILKPFTTVEYTCDNGNIVEAFEELHPSDKVDFDFRIDSINWSQVFRDSYHGSRKRLLREDMSNVQSARLKMRLLQVVEMVIKCLFFASMAWVVLKVYGSNNVSSVYSASMIS